MNMYPYEPVDIDFLSSAPIRHVTTIDIDAPPEKVFEVLKDGKSWPQWVGAITRVDWTSEPPFEVGTTRTVYMQGNQVADEYFFLWEDGRRMAFYFVAASFNAFTQFAEDYQLEALPGERTRLRWTFAVNPTRLHRIILTVLGPIMKRFLKHIMKRLKGYVEARA